MQRVAIVVLLLAGLAVTTSMIFLKTKKQAPAGNGFAVVELFTSEGCSSCPPADEAVAKLLDTYKSNVFVLSFHVDYWNYLGWKDAYSNNSYSQRQQQYSHALKLSSIYTPQAIVNGTSEFTGSDRRKLQATVAQGLNAKSESTITLSAKAVGNTVDVAYNLQGPTSNLLNVALVQLHAQSSVQRGENTGKLLHHVNVVRDFKTVKASVQNGSISFALPAGLAVKDCGIIAYTQDGASFKVTAAASADIQ